MTLVDGFLKFWKKNGMSSEGIQSFKMENFTGLYFGTESDENINYNVTLMLYDDNKSADIWVRKPITNHNILKELNDLNYDYRYYTFVFTGDSIGLRGSVNTNSDIDVVIKEMLQMMNLAREEFKKFK